MVSNPAPLTAEDLLDLPLPNGVRGYELVNGRPVAVTPAYPTHGELIVELASRLRNHLEEKNLPGRVYSDVGFVLRLPQDRERMRAPDVSFVTESKVIEHGDPAARFFRGAPDLAAEVELTPGRKRGGQSRIDDYLQAGARLVWVIHPRTRTATVYRQDGSIQVLRENESLEGEDVLPGFSLPLATLFREVP